MKAMFEHNFDLVRDTLQRIIDCAESEAVRDEAAFALRKLEAARFYLNLNAHPSEGGTVEPSSP